MVVPANLFADWRAQRPATFPLREDGPPPERLLQAVWHHQRVLRDQLVLADGQTLRVLHPGFRNREAGPDFRDAIVQFGAASPQRGDVEVDLAASGWRAHRHDVNPNFRGVVLHVIWDGAAIGELPTLPLKHQLDAPLRELANWFGGDGAPSGELAGKCCGPLHELARPQLQAILQQAALVRLQLKAEQLAARARQCGWEQSLWEGLFAALGYKHNVWPMRRIAEMAGASPDKLAVAAWQSRLSGWSGLLPVDLPRGHGADGDFVRRHWDAWWRERDRFAEVTLPRAAWRMSGLRPANQPLNFLCASPHASRARFTLGSRRGRPRQHAVFGGNPALARVPAERWDAILDAGGAYDFGAAGLDQHGAFGVHQIVRGYPGGAELFGKSIVVAHVCLV